MGSKINQYDVICTLSSRISMFELYHCFSENKGYCMPLKSTGKKGQVIGAPCLKGAEANFISLFRYYCAFKNEAWVRSMIFWVSYRIKF